MTDTQTQQQPAGGAGACASTCGDSSGLCTGLQPPAAPPAPRPAQEQQEAAAQEQAAAPERQEAPPPVQQTAAAGDSEGSGNEAGEEGLNAELGAWLSGRLQRMQPGAELDEGSVRVLGALLDTIATRVLDEAQRVNAASACETAAGNGSAAAAQQQQQQQQQQQKRSTLTSLDIHKALKRVLPGEPSDGRLRPYLPAEVKQAWHLDKQSLKGIKKQKAAGPATAGTAPDGCKENAAAAAAHQQLQQ
ncbi:hypothetical protein C2E20_3546 [Micractinium conductrix]|uniref:Uncharacterized protein n=1 Tax=Micractinium conductrix TaxID=554055 RepID=A0A2P6VHE8_9CHLO|nr:hypothetical protein C2E20_3546 [Micractinium conductrix]|eukprot:PSC73505.1 hypothetical protein C2E20_3546 [Micractinium conductrix]